MKELSKISTLRTFMAAVSAILVLVVSQVAAGSWDRTRNNRLFCKATIRK